MNNYVWFHSKIECTDGRRRRTDPSQQKRPNTMDTKTSLTHFLYLYEDAILLLWKTCSLEGNLEWGSSETLTGSMIHQGWAVVVAQVVVFRFLDLEEPGLELYWRLGFFFYFFCLLENLALPCGEWVSFKVQDQDAILFFTIPRTYTMFAP